MKDENLINTINIERIPLTDKHFNLLKDIVEVYENKIDNIEVYADNFTIYFK